MLKELFGGGGGPTLLESAFNDVTTMLAQGGKMLDYALTALFENEPLSVDLDEMDDVIDNSERMVRRTVLEHMTVNPQQDLVASLILVSMVQDAERIGDFARGLAEVKDLAQSPLTGPPADELRALASRLRPLFELCDRAFREDDVEGARQVIATHAELKPEFIAYVERLSRSELSADLAIAYSSIARNLRRISAHLSNIASTVTQPYDRIRHGDEEA
jgi:phosphate uptake regulator